MRLLDDYHFLTLDQETVTDPYPFFSRLRHEAPVFHEPDYGVYLVSRYEDIVEISRDTATWSAIAQVTGPFLPLPAPGADLDAWRRSRNETDKLFTNDPPEHTRYRSLVARLFTAKRVSRLEDNLRAQAFRLIDRFIDAGSVEFVKEFSYVYPLLTVGELLGVPLADNSHFEVLFRREFERMDEKFVGNPEAPLEDISFRPELVEYFRKELSERQKNPRGDIMTELCNATFPDGEKVPFDDLVNTCIFLYGAGGDANVPQILTNGMELLVDHPDLMSELRSDRSKVAAFVEETLRYNNSAIGLFRLARKETVVRGVTIPQGALVMILYGSGNRDETVFDDPETFRLDRKPNRVLSFGHGPHLCPGASLTRLETRVAFETLLDRLQNIRRSRSQTTTRYLPSCLQRGATSLSLDFDPTPALRAVAQ